MDGVAMTAIIGEGLDIDKATTDAVVQAKVNAVVRVQADDRPLPADMLRMLHVVFDADLQHLLKRSKVTSNVTCMRVMALGLTDAGMSYILDRPIMRLTPTLV